MSRRAAAREETRRRIVEATAKLHGENGVFGTSWQDIAREADVSVATVYAHFPSLQELLPACGALVMERARPPSPESAAEIIGDARGRRKRLKRVAEELFAFYDRGGRHLDVDVRERQLPGHARVGGIPARDGGGVRSRGAGRRAPGCTHRSARQRLLRSSDLQGAPHPRGERQARCRRCRGGRCCRCSSAGPDGHDGRSSKRRRHEHRRKIGRPRFRLSRFPAMGERHAGGSARSP